MKEQNALIKIFFWYYILVRAYVTVEGEYYLFCHGADDWIRNVKIDNQLKYEGGHPPCQPPGSISLGVLGVGYHLLELEFGEQWSGGGLSFDIATMSSIKAQMDRFRIYVPNYGDDTYEYTVKTWTTFSMEDEYFLVGYADDYIEQVHTDGLLWQDWMWNCGEYGTIYAWGDGFCYPLGRKNKDYSVEVSFTYGEIWASGLLDFRIVSWTNQKAKIGKPKYYASASIMNLGGYITVNNGNIYGGSRWDDPDKPEISERTYETRTIYNVSYNDGTVWFNTELEVGVGNWWAEWGLTKGTHDDVGVPLNFTVRNFNSNLPTGQMGICFRFWYLYLFVNTVDVYSFQNLRITGIEADVGDSKGKITPDYTIAMDFGGDVILTIAGFLTAMPGGQMAGVIGACVGISAKGIAAVLDYAKGQIVSRYDSPITEDHHWQLKSEGWFSIDPFSGQKSESDLFFLGLNPTAGKSCGLTKIVLKGTLAAVYSEYCITFPPTYKNTYYPIGDIEITLCIPWFIWP